MKKSVIVTVGITLVSSLVFGVEALADYSSKGNIEFEADTSITPPVDPVDPSTPVTPIDPVDPEGPPTGTVGPLSIDFASSFQFNKQTISTKDKVYQAQLQTFKDAKDGPNYVQVTDKRGTGEGWTLSVTQAEQFKTEDDKELEGAELSFKTAMTISTTADTFRPGTIKTEDNFTPGTALELVKAEQDQGMGTWVYKFGADAAEGESAVTLEVPGASVKLAKVYQTTLNWSLQATP